MSQSIEITIQSHETILTLSSGKIAIPIGDENLNGYTPQHSPITPYEAEIAIEHIEDVIMPIIHQLPSQPFTAICLDPRLQSLLPDYPQSHTMSTELLENKFNEIINVINGAPIQSTNIPTDQKFTLFLLIIREISHHWRLDHFVIS
ncbi:hypothetical protein [Wohlfahrtiimonas populi]|uniref:hypothetical protein n=1 Tax=Wohlfahrtiimonas populi TaxID=1940240 RepID=UPI00098D02FD|nr:hypothetical protein [Wohlfahrtiimonas populi]